ncbi:TPA: hypothetical protein U5E28_002972 [Yersinia enterocolitica]|nr:hypothetical protein [Yersinia enterocolitica]
MMNRFIAFSPYPSSFNVQVCWLRSITRITDLSQLIGMHSLAAFLHTESYWVSMPSFFNVQVCWLRSITRITDLSQLIGMHSLAAFLHTESYWVSMPSFFNVQVCWLCSLLGPSMGLTSTRPQQAALKSAPSRVVTRITD